MILILEMVEAEIGQRLRSALEKQGDKALLLTSMQIAQEVSISFSLSAQKAGFQLCYQDLRLKSETLQGVYCGITAFPVGLFTRFSPEDAQYAALEMQALWLAMLSCLTCPLINPPALDTLAGSLLSPVELAGLARSVGITTPFMVCVENGRTAAQIQQSQPSARFSDLGKPWLVEINHPQIDLSDLSQNPNQYLIQENPPGLPVGIGIIGKRLLAYELSPGNRFKTLDYAKIPVNIRSQVRKLQKRLRLNAAEYLFKVHHGDWVLCAVTHPLHFTLQAYQDEAYAALANFLSG